ncbi:uncharacterized protein LOC128683833 isoform X2 [Plodia interpunctella]|uniref:uncharacterized protein LOC128683833 isoform X2 n=1 Tax=Plodia interpunctella TaxID=58824 RepID=UPI0023683E09|nr:uncharacterized protein LOC128683833 isoform X2 [Plodia interpunctella]
MTEAAKKPATAIARPPISDSSLMYIPEDAVEGFQERIETGIEWTLIEKGALYHRTNCFKDDIPSCTFTESLNTKLENSIYQTFLDNESNIKLEDKWELLLPIALWDNEKFSNEEGKICFRSANNLTEDMDKIIKNAVKAGDQDGIMKDFYLVDVLRVNDAKMTELDNGLKKFKNLITLTLCGNYISDIDATCLPSSLRTLELQANRIKSVHSFAEHLPNDLLYLGLSRNLLNDDSVEGFSHIPYNITVLDLSDNDIYQLEPLLEILARLPNLSALHLAGNPCAVCAGYARVTLLKLPRLRWLDSREILITDRPPDTFEPHPDDLRAAYFNFTIFRIMSAPQPPKPEKGAVTTFHIELELPLLDPIRRAFLMFRRNDSLTEMLPPPEDEEWMTPAVHPSSVARSKSIVGNTTTTDLELESLESDIYNHLVPVNSREIRHYTIFESNKIVWNKVMNFQEPAIKIFCPDLVALRNTFRSTITVRLIYSVSITVKPGKAEKKSQTVFKQPAEQRVTLMTAKCALRRLDWSQPSQHFHWDDSLESDEAIHWGDGDLSIIQYSQAPVKVTKGKQESEVGSSRQLPPENLTCHFGFGIDTLRA